jgi:hypothetical protein
VTEKPDSKSLSLTKALGLATQPDPKTFDLAIKLDPISLDLVVEPKLNSIFSSLAGKEIRSGGQTKPNNTF